MTLKEEVEQLRKEIKHLHQQSEKTTKQIKELKKDLEEQNNKWNKILACASVVSALTAIINLLVISFKK